MPLPTEPGYNTPANRLNTVAPKPGSVAAKPAVDTPKPVTHGGTFMNPVTIKLLIALAGVASKLIPEVEQVYSDVKAGGSMTDEAKALLADAEKIAETLLSAL